MLLSGSHFPLFSQTIEEVLKESDWQRRRGERTESYRLLNLASTQSQSQNNPTLKAKVLSKKAKWFRYFMKYDSANIYGKLALDCVEKNNLQTLKPQILLQNGWHKESKFDYEKALKYCKTAKSLAQDQNQMDIIIKADVCIERALGAFYMGSLGGDQYPYYSALEKYEKAAVYLKETKDTTDFLFYWSLYLDLFRHRGSPDSVDLLITELENFLSNHPDLRSEASVYTQRSILADINGESDLVYKNLIKAQEISQKLDLPRLTQHYYIRLHDHFKGLGNFEKAVEMLDSASATYHTNHMHANGMDLYYHTYKEADNTEMALEYLEKWHNHEDWERKNEKVDLITEWETKYKTQEKEVELLRQKTQQYWLLAFLGLIFFSGVFLLRAYHRQKKAKERLATQHKIIEHQATELQKLDKIKSRFFANVSHELRTPLTLMLGPISSALKKGDLNNRNFTLLQLAQHNGKQLLKLINSILDLAKLESDKLELKEAAVEFYSLLRRTLSQFESSAELKGIKLIIDYQLESYLKLELDVLKFETIMNNLLSNALKFTPKGGQIKVIAKEQRNQISIEVSDTGSGIHSDDLPQIFNRFYQSKQPNAPTEGGTGIGLALSKKLAMLLNGELSARSQLGEGSTFTFLFPKKEVLGYVEQEDFIEESEEIPNIELIPPTSKEGKRPAILLVEDNYSLRQYLQIILGERYHLTTAENGKVAFDLLTKNKDFQLILSDVMMPVMDGYQLLEKLKSDPQFHSIPFIMLTARAELKDKLKALRIGVDDYLLKPFEEEELVARIENLLKNSLERANIQLSDTFEAPDDSTISNDSKSLTPEDLEWLTQFEALVNEKITDLSFTIDDLPQLMAISRTQLFRRLKKLTGLTPNQYIREVRLQKARQLLEENAYSTVKEVCYAVGFRKTQYFSKLFLNRFGKIPSDYLNHL